MTKDEIKKMAREAGFSTGTRDYADGNGGHPFVAPVSFGSCLPEIERFAALVAAKAAEKEREACAKVVEPSEEHRRDASWGYLGGTEGVEILDGLAAAIRSRGNREK